MAIPESQLDTWSHQGSITQSSNTYQSIRRALLADNSGYADKQFSVFLQGSYGNDTNIYAESDVDIVIRLESIYRGDTSKLSPAELQVYGSQTSSATYTFDSFKAAVILHLQSWFGARAITVGPKAIKIAADANRRSADVVPCFEYRQYKSYSLQNTTDYESGIIFPTSSGEIVNYPKHHSDNLTAQHQASGGMLKPMARILKNLRSRMIADGIIKSGVAPSYYIEGLFYNVPPAEYVRNSYGDTFVKGINWLLKADPTKLVCANWKYYLLGNSNVQWNKTDFDTFLDRTCKTWNQW